MEDNQITDPLEVIYSSQSNTDVIGAKNFLESEGIPTFMQNEIAGQLYGNIADIPKLLVKQTDFEKAHALLITGGYLPG
ncbi:Putative signal transducing protein [Arachidicoccus rhizosphaerae]|uniref:Putative signal transducing protein n=1 Tax=Arachidicoccus rhizosphaerae TaxID=551991 RepID=A0A1H3Y3E0_9BACT|nr:DUF2007 domain-containing protein [Arachidicoccus rhizosphaerae]SEA05354.1 Putative signal transducing protein [Arachidicoccus rhizosphaerae]